MCVFNFEEDVQYMRQLQTDKLGTQLSYTGFCLSLNNRMQGITVAIFSPCINIVISVI